MSRSAATGKALGEVFEPGLSHPPTEPENAPAGAPVATLPALAFLARVASLLPEEEAAAFRKAIKRAEAGERLETALNLPPDWRTRERNAMFLDFRAKGLSPSQIERELKKGRGAFPEEMARLSRLCESKAPCARHIRRIVSRT